MGILDEDVAAVRAASDIVGVISQYLQLRRVGRRWVGLCPFHPEHTPSFSVNAEENLYYCFGCQARGDVITFVREVEHLDFVAAVEWLAGRCGVTLRYTERNESEGRKKRARLVEIMGRAVDWYHQRLLSGGDAGPARRYLRERGLEGDVVRDYRIGWAPDGWDELCRALSLGENDARETGLGFRNARNRLQDSFRARVMFPIFDAQGEPVSLGGRILPGSDDPRNHGKYKNTPETGLYHKSKVLYGLDRAKGAIVSSDTAVVCEGYTDVIGFHRSGVPSAVATCGTALTDEHVKLLRRYARKLVLAFDADGAGQAAAERFYQWEREHDLEVAVADLPVGQDPADLARSDAPRLAAAVDGARPFLRFRLDRAFAAADLTSPEGRAKAAERALAIVAEHPVDLVRDQYLMEVAGRCRLEPERLRPTLDQLRSDEARRARAVASTTTQGPGRTGRSSAPRRSRPPDGAGDDDIPHPAETSQGGRMAGPNGSGARVPYGGHAQADARSANNVARHVDGPALEVLRHAVHSPDEVREWLHPELFADPLQREALQVLGEAASPAAAVAASPAPLADFLARLVVDEPRSEPFEAVRRQLTEIARSAVGDLRLAGAGVDDSAAALADLAFLGRCIDDLRNADTSVVAANRLLAWLRQRVGDGG
jgi:DNA primase